MATIAERPQVKRPGRKPIHPYNEWFSMLQENPDKSVSIIEGEDYNSSTKTMRHNIYRERDKRELNVETVTLKDDKDEVIGLGLVLGEKKTEKPAEKSVAKSSKSKSTKTKATASK